MTLAIGTVLQSRYRIDALLGQGGMGAVYLAGDLNLPARQWAIKEMTPDPNAPPQAIAQARQQFLQEASVLATLDHPNLPKVSDYFTFGGSEYLVMDFVQGNDLEQVLQNAGAPLPEAQVLTWADQLLDALEYLHEQSPRAVIHRDIKPMNIILTAHNRVKLVDFGLVKLYDPAHPTTMTVLKGWASPAYAPPEQYPGSPLRTDARSDLYSLGATLYHLLTNQEPAAVPLRTATPQSLSSLRSLNPNVFANTEQVVLRAMELDISQRYQSAAQMRQALTAPSIAAPAPGKLKWYGWLGGITAILIILLVAVGTWLLRGRGEIIPTATPFATVVAVATVPTPASSTPTVPAPPTATEMPSSTATASLSMIAMSSDTPIASPTATVLETLTQTVSLSGTHTIQRGETLYSVARQYGITYQELMTANNIVNANFIYVGQRLIIPVLYDTPTTQTPSITKIPSSIATTLLIPTETVIPSDTPTALLAVRVEKTPAQTTPSSGIHVVQRGETIFSIAIQYDTTVQALMLGNNIANRNFIYPGQQLIVPAPVPSYTPVPCHPGVEETIYIFQRGDNLFRIAMRYGVSLQELAAANGLTSTRITHVGQRLVIPCGEVPPTATRVDID